MNLNRQHFIPLSVVILLTVATAKLPPRMAAQAKIALSGLFLPLFGLTASAQELGDKAAEILTPRAELVRQLESARQENEQMRIQLSLATSVAAENQRLRNTLGLQQSSPWKLRLAQVVARDPANWWRTIRIDLGSRDGVPANAPVLTDEGLVGRIAEVGYTHSMVVLLGDPDCRVSALIEETREHGVITPDSANPVDNILVDLKYLSRNSRLKAGQRVLTSGLGGIFPKGILIGQVVDFHAVDYGLYTEARVNVAVNLNTLEEVWVMVR